MGVLLESFWLEAVLGISALFIIIYRFWTLRYNYWKDQNVPHLEPTFPFGNTKDILLSRKFIGRVFQDLYNQLEGHKYGGIISMRRPQLILRDPELIKIFMTKDFNHFTDRGISFDEEMDPLSAHLFNLTGERWRILRAKLTPTFTSGKMKMMFHLMQACAKLLEESLIEYADKEETIELKDYMARFGTDVIGACAFGLEIDSIKNPDNEFRRISKELFKPRMIVIVRNLLNSIIPGVSNILKIKTTPKDREDFFFKVVGDTIKYRETNKVVRNDFLDLLIQIRNKGQLDDESADKNEKVESSSKLNGVSNGIYNSKHSGNGVVSHKSDDIYLTNELMTAQCFVFFIAGFETSSTTLSFCLYELALNQSIQKKLQAEVDRVLAKHNGEITYDALKEMTYMDQVVQEALRKYPPVPFLTRECVQEYTVQEGNFKIRKGDRVAISLFGIHYDPEHYPEPERFDPDRFTEEAKQSRHHYTWLPFGEGPRICIGMRFGLMQVKSGLATVLSKYNFDRVPETLVPMEFSIDSFVTAPRDGIKLKISKRVK